MSLSASRLSSRRAHQLLFDLLDLHLNPGDILEVRGQNGSGKTTLLRMLCGLRRPDEGRITWEGECIFRSPESFRSALCYLGHQTGLKADLNPVENLRADCALHGGEEDGIETALAEMNLHPVLQQPCRALSAGQKQKVALARLKIRSAKLWILDEPCASLDLKAQTAVSQLMQKHAADGGMVVFTTHQPLNLPEALCKKLWLGRDGQP